MEATKRDFAKCRGRPAGWGRDLVEEARPLPVSLLRQRGALSAGFIGTLLWGDGSRAEVRAQQGQLEIVSPSGWAQQLPLSCRPCRLGGHEQLLICPRCNRARRALYWTARGFECRLCADLRYESQRLPRDLRVLKKALRRPQSTEFGKQGCWRDVGIPRQHLHGAVTADCCDFHRGQASLKEPRDSFMA